MVKRPPAGMTGEPIPAPNDDLCLAFANTRYWRGTTTPTEELNGIDDLLRWAEKAERLPPALVKRFATHWGSEPARPFGEAICLRETIFLCFTETAAQRAPTEKDIAALNAALADAPARRRVHRGGWDIGIPGPSAGALLAPTLWSAADLLVGGQLARVRQCANPACGWLFLDNSKSGNRRWCSMSACGNRAKAHRHYVRQKGK
jgi:predicted RNA-binding Zn ribbon-like protein